MRKRMLFLSARNQCGENLGDELRTENFLNILLEKFDIDLLEYCHCEQELLTGSVPALTVHRVNRISTPGGPLLRTLNRLRSGTDPADAGKHLRTRIKELCGLHTYSHVFISHRLLANCIDMVASLLPGAVIITDAQRTLRRPAGREGIGKRGIKQHYHKINAARVRRDELKLVNKTGLLLTASEWDALSFKALSFADAGKVHVIPPFVNLQEYQYSEPARKENGIVLHWNMHTVKGKNAGLLFYRKIYPLIQAEIPDCKCYIMGADVHPELLELAKADSSVVIAQEVGLAADYIRRSKAVIASLREGYGELMQILEAWALRTPVVTSPKGAEQLICENGRNILLADTAEGIADHVVKLLQTPELGSIIAERAYRTLLKHYELKKVKAKVLSLV
ncbi:glycosyltransferase family 4 protein [Paenibacillus sp. BAC0078]